MSAAPSGTVTFLFTDVEGSTRLWEERADEMRSALAEHDAIIRAAIDAYGGYVFSTGGDGFGAAFARAADAVDAAGKAQAGLADHPLIRVRMGLHTGEVHERGGDYFGPAVNRIARIMAAGHGGQMLLSQTTAEVIGRDATLVDLGELGAPPAPVSTRPTWCAGRSSTNGRWSCSTTFPVADAGWMHRSTAPADAAGRHRLVVRVARSRRAHLFRPVGRLRR